MDIIFYAILPPISALGVAITYFILLEWGNKLYELGRKRAMIVIIGLALAIAAIVPFTWRWLGAPLLVLAMVGWIARRMYVIKSGIRPEEDFPDYVDRD